MPEMLISENSSRFIFLRVNVVLGVGCDLEGRLKTGKKYEPFRVFESPAHGVSGTAHIGLSLSQFKDRTDETLDVKTDSLGDLNLR